MCFKSVIQSGRSLFLSKIKNTSLKLPVGVSPLQLVNLQKGGGVNFKEKNKNLLRLKLKSALKIEHISVVCK
jgi:hypothetical protein